MHSLHVLGNTLLQDLQNIGLKGDFLLSLRPYSKTRFGVYNPNNNTIGLYIYSNAKHSEVYSYEHILNTLIHEACHYKQWKDPEFKRVKGVMHDLDFKTMYNYYTGLAKECNLYEKEVRLSEKSFKSS